MPSRVAEIGELLLQLEAEMRHIGLWEEVVPNAEDLASEEPFCIDTLELSQWLQWIFIPKMIYLLENQQPLPEFCAVTEVAEEAFQGMKQDMLETLRLIKQIDERICLKC